jgi:integrase
MNAPAVKVSEFKNPSGEVVYRVYGWEPSKDGNRRMVRKNFKDVAQADDFARRLREKWTNVVSYTALKYTSLSDEDLRAAERAAAILAGKPLAAAVDFYLANYREPRICRSLNDAFTEFIAEKRQENLRPRSISDLKTRVGFLLKVAGGMEVSDMTESKLRAIVHRDSDGRGPESRNNDRRALNGFFAWAAAKRYCAENPMAGIAPIRFHRREPEIFSLAAVESILTAARGFQGGAMLPYFVLALFSAIRPTEIQRLTWRDVDLLEKTVRLGGAAAKKRQRRLVELSDNAVVWLRPLVIRQLPIWPARGRKMFEEVRELAGFGSSKKNADELKAVDLIPWIQDGMRHTAISCHFAQHGHEGDTARWAGNSPDEMHKSYKQLVSKADAAIFWNIYPEKNKVVSPAFCKSSCKSAAESA